MARTELKPLSKPSTPAASTEAAPAPRKLAEVKPTPKVGLKPLAPKAAPAPEPLVEAEIIVNDIEAVTESGETIQAKEAIIPAGTEIVVREETPLAVVSSVAPAFVLGQTTGPIEQSDLYRPRLELSQSVGPLMDAGFTPGQIVLAKEEPIWGEGYDPLKITLLAGRKQFIEDVAYGSGQEQRTFNSPAEVKAAGLWTEWHDNTPPPVFPRLTYVALIEKPEYVNSPLFGIELLDSLYAIAEIRWDGAAYSRAAKPVLTAGSGILAKGLHRGYWQYSCERAKLKVNTVTVPVIKFGGFHTEEFVKAVSDLAW
jgi:hypothetical protein